MPNSRGNMAQIAAARAKFIITAVVVLLKRELKYKPLPVRNIIIHITSIPVWKIANGWMNPASQKAIIWAKLHYCRYSSRPRRKSRNSTCRAGRPNRRRRRRSRCWWARQRPGTKLSLGGDACRRKHDSKEHSHCHENYCVYRMGFFIIQYV